MTVQTGSSHWYLGNRHTIQYFGPEHFRYAIQTCAHWAPQATPGEGTFILREVETLDANEQQTLLRWLEDAGAAVQVISMASTPLFPLVLEGRFLESLYCRLNVLYISADESVGGAG